MYGHEGEVGLRVKLQLVADSKQLFGLIRVNYR